MGWICFVQDIPDIEGQKRVGTLYLQIDVFESLSRLSFSLLCVIWTVVLDLYSASWDGLCRRNPLRFIVRESLVQLHDGNAHSLNSVSVSSLFDDLTDVIVIDNSYQVIGHAVLASVLWVRARSLDLGCRAAITSFYMLIWKAHVIRLFSRTFEFSYTNMVSTWCLIWWWMQLFYRSTCWCCSSGDIPAGLFLGTRLCKQSNCWLVMIAEYSKEVS